MGLWSTQAAALSLGRITVQSALGEPLRAEIDVLDINPEEAASLVTKVAPAEAFLAAGLEYNPTLNSLRATLQRRPDGRAYLRLISERAIGEPFVDMILETSWNSGRIVRDYTMLFDPPALRKQAAGSPVGAQLPAPAPERISPATRAAAAAAVASPTVSRPSATPSQPTAPKAAAAAAKPVAMEPAPAAPAVQKATSAEASVKVKPGDTASAIAAAHKSANVSLDQMLVALLRANPDAFIQDNVNRIKAGAIVTLPSQEQATATGRAEATQIISAQSQDFNDFRRKLASNVPGAKLSPASRDVSGKIEATVDDKKPAAATPDKLTLSKGSVQAKSGEEALAKERNAEAAAQRSAELAKNIQELDQLAKASSAPASAAASTPEPVASAPEAVPAPQAEVKASEPASTPAVTPPKQPAPPPVQPEPAPETSFFDDLLENPMLLPGAGALVALLAGLGLYKRRQRKQAEQLDSTFANSDLAFSGGSGGQNVDTGDSLTTGSSMVYSPSQLDAVDDVDPVAEADVYLAYGRDLQAEEILKDALRTQPQRVAIHQKLLDIYAKRRDLKAFEAIAALAFNLTDGTGPEWEQICEKGLAIDPDNALYLPGGQPLPSQLPDFQPSAPATVTMGSPIAAAKAQDDAPPPPIATGPSDLDLDLDFSLDEPADLPGPAVPEPTEPPPHSDAIPTAFSGLSAFEETPLPTLPEEPPAVDEPAAEEPSFEEPAFEAPQEEPSGPSTVRDPLADDLDFSLDTPELQLDLPPTADEAAASTAANDATTQANNELMSFDLGSLSLDLGEDKVTVPGEFVDETMDPLETKLALADEFRAIGDDDGARALIEEVIAEAAGDLRSKAQSALAKL
ncbi:fimbrial protein FimV [Rhodoferax sp. U11-2br]|nr:FimV/HubP family polar landmark protein [Rhodoferax sp. U11-2br]MBT3066051.1 fimbrial protein FimV [Rhodoferax sp. U11-2br]